MLWQVGQNSVRATRRARAIGEADGERQSLPAADARPECPGRCRTARILLTSLSQRNAHRRGLKRAAMAVAHRILIIAFYIIRDGVAYREMGGDYHNRLHPVRTARRLIHRLKSLGYEVDLAQLGISQERLADQDPRGRPLGSKTKGDHNQAPASKRQSASASRSQDLPQVRQLGHPCIQARNQISKLSDSAPQHHQ